MQRLTGNSVYPSFPCVRGVSDHISQILRKFNIFTYNRPGKTISSQIYLGKYPFTIDENSSVYRISDFCGLLQIRRTD